MEASALHAPVGVGRVSISAPLLRLRSDDQLVALFRAGNEDAFRVIHDRYRQRLFAYTRQMLSGSRTDAEDALQDVFLRAYGALRADARPVMLRAWLYRVAHNRCVDHLRRRVPPAADVFDMSRGPLADPIEQAERREDLRRLVSDLRKLPEQQRSALLMREMEGLSYVELASALDVSVPAVKSLLVRARVSLVEAIEARDTDCVDIQHDIAAAMDRGVRANGRVRRHVRECTGCKDYNTRLRGVQRSFNELSPGHGPVGFLAKLLGIGGAGSGAAAGGTAAGGGAAAAVGTSAVAVTATKVAAIVCCAALTAGGAVEIGSKASRSSHHAHHAPQAVAGASAIPAPIIATLSQRLASHTSQAQAVVHHRTHAHHATHLRAVASAPAATAVPVDPTTTDAVPAGSVEPTTGGVQAPDEDTATTSTDPSASSDPTAPAAPSDAGSAPATGSSSATGSGAATSAPTPATSDATGQTPAAGSGPTASSASVGPAVPAPTPAASGGTPAAVTP